jgi:hypothetical protein
MKGMAFIRLLGITMQIGVFTKDKKIFLTPILPKVSGEI